MGGGVERDRQGHREREKVPNRSRPAFHQLGKEFVKERKKERKKKKKKKAEKKKKKAITVFKLHPFSHVSRHTYGRRQIMLVDC